jgi:hypothetical protein
MKPITWFIETTHRLFFLICTLMAINNINAQLPDSLLSVQHIESLSSKEISRLEKAYENMNNAFDKQTIRYIKKLQKQEDKIRKKLAKVNPQAAKELFENSTSQYEQYKNTITNKVTTALPNSLQNYIPNLDSVGTSLKFLQHVSPNISNNNALLQLQNLQHKLNTTAQLEAYIKQRKQQLRETLQKYALEKYANTYFKEGYYYIQQLKEYRTLLNNPQRLEQTIISLASRIPVFNKFMQQFGIMAAMFPSSPSEAANTNALYAGLQTRDQVMQDIQSRLGADAAGVMNTQIQQSIADATQYLDKLKNNIRSLGGNSGNFNMPDFKGKANPMRTKTFLQRLQLKTDWAPQRSNNIVPNNIDMGVGLAYQLSTSKTVGTMLTYKLGTGNGLQNIKLTNEGLGFRSFADMRFKRNFWLVTGYEWQYQFRFNSINALRGQAWQQLALAGISKKYKVGKNGGEFKVLYDFLAKKQYPQTQSFIFRTGLNF